ncbi:HHL159Wp [Eremothecium sinecaudum]|uniref:HHL159Wp n=1 Tax=Eremothecium sinecaudum TaxID=45286 RepID=A0A0X8HW56_9SACH|nr:HHL159Wp [Eremothecium sinecaudum]AMD22611.1 HHL159Wp [Eremothecium sinecaudum]
MADNTRVKRKRTRPFELYGPNSVGTQGADSSPTVINIGEERLVEGVGRVSNGAFYLDEDRDPLINEMLQRQTYMLGNNFGSPYGVETVAPETHEQPLVFGNDMDEDMVGGLRALNNTVVGGNYTSRRYKKQRTVSLPQLPHAKLYYRDFVAPGDIGVVPRRGQTDEELLHISGSSSLTLNSNQAVKLPVIRSTSPNSDALLADPTIDPSEIDPNSNALGASLGVGTTLSLSQPKFSKLLGRKSRTIKKEYFKTDKDGHYIYRENDLIANGRFTTKELLGQGTFGKVIKCTDNKELRKKFVAIKIIRAVDRYRQAAKTELRVLQTIKEHDPLGSYQCLVLRECFDYKNHICLVTDLFGKSIYDFMCNNGNPRFPGSHVQAISRQLIRSVCFLHDLGIIHTDLKPENILICDESYVEVPLSGSLLATLSTRRKQASGGKQMILTNPEVKLIDFGSAVFCQEYHPPVISTRHYRAPEIVLGLGWSFPCDVWSIGCVLVELVTGESLYPIHENLEHMAMMQRINGESIARKMVSKMFYKVEHKLGNVPSDLMTTVVRHFDKNTMTLQWPERNYKGEIVTKEKSMKRVMTTCDRLDKLISAKLQKDFGEWLVIDWDFSPEQNWAMIESKFYSRNLNLDREIFLFWYWFVDLCRKLFEFDPTERITAKEAMGHEWFNYGILDDGISSFGRL